MEEKTIHSLTCCFGCGSAIRCGTHRFSAFENRPTRMEGSATAIHQPESGIGGLEAISRRIDPHNRPAENGQGNLFTFSFNLKVEFNRRMLSAGTHPPHRFRYDASIPARKVSMTLSFTLLIGKREKQNRSIYIRHRLS